VQANRLVRTRQREVWSG